MLNSHNIVNPFYQSKYRDTQISYLILIGPEPSRMAEPSQAPGISGGCLDAHTVPRPSSPLRYSPRLLRTTQLPRPGHSAIRMTGEPLPIVHWNRFWLAIPLPAVGSGPCESASAGFLVVIGHLAGITNERHSWQSRPSVVASPHLHSVSPGADCGQIMVGEMTDVEFSCPCWQIIKKPLRVLLLCLFFFLFSSPWATSLPAFFLISKLQGFTFFLGYYI
jgi:hypothetical protein